VELHQAQGGIKMDAINMSLVTNDQFASECDMDFPVLSGACQAALEAGIGIFAASGNTGNITKISSPACLSSVYAVGSSTLVPPDEVSGFTSRNTLLDLLAPGECSTIHFGTSPASAQAAAVACFLREVDSALEPAALLRVLSSTGVSVLDPATGLNFPRIDALGAVSALKRTPFHRADSNVDGKTNIADSIHILDALFFGGTAPPCRESADVQNDGVINLSDVVHILNFLFLGGPPPTAPGPADSPCGQDLDPPGSPGDLGCEAYGQCTPTHG